MVKHKNCDYLFVKNKETNEIIGGGASLVSLDPFYLYRGEQSSLYLNSNSRGLNISSIFTEGIPEYVQQVKKVGIWQAQVFDSNLSSEKMYEKSEFLKERQSLNWEYIDYQKPPLTDEAFKLMVKDNSEEIMKKIENSKNSKNCIKFIWNTEKGFSDLLNSNFNDFTMLKNVLDCKKSHKKNPNKILKKFINLLCKSEGTEAYNDQNMAIITINGKVEGYCATANQGHFFGGYRNIRFSTLCLKSDAYQVETIVEGLKEIHYTLAYELEASLVRIDLPNDMVKNENLIGYLSEIGVELTPFNVYIKRSKLI